MNDGLRKGIDIVEFCSGIHDENKARGDRVTHSIGDPPYLRSRQRLYQPPYATWWFLFAVPLPHEFCQQCDADLMCTLSYVIVVVSRFVGQFACVLYGRQRP